MSEALKALNNIRTLRAQGRELPLEVLEELLEKLSVVVDERRQEESSKKAEQEARQEKLDSLRKLMLEDGIDPEELLSSFSAKSSAPKKLAIRVRRNIRLPMKMVKRKPGLAKGAPLKRWLSSSRPVSHWMISSSK
jgi:DNA-binding protein H-NS